MPAPTSYTESTLAAFMRSELADSGPVLGLTQDSQFTEAVNDVALAMETPIAAVTDVALLRAYARREAWRLAMRQSAADVKVSSGGTSGAAATYEWQQAHAQAKAMYTLCVEAVADLVAAATPPTSSASRSTAGPVPITITW